jgi:hypothetical protein
MGLLNQWEPSVAFPKLRNGYLRAEKGVINNRLLIPDFEHDVTIFLTSGKRALQGIAECLNQFYGLTIFNARFYKGREQLLKLPRGAP